MGAISGIQTRKNLGSNFAFFAINIAIGIFLVPYFISTLGIAAYGIIPLSTSLIGYLGIVTGSLNAAVSRHLTIDMQNPDITVANRTFNSAFFGLSKTIATLVPAVLLISFFAPSIFGLSSENSADAAWLFLGIGLAFLIRAWSSSFTVTLYGSNRLDLINTINILNIVVQICLIFTLFSVSGPALAIIGASYFIGALVATVAAYLIFRRLNNTLSITYEHYESGKFREMAQMSGWIIINEIGSYLLINMDIVLVTYLYGSAVGGKYAIAYQWVTLFGGMAGTFLSILGPVILIAYANGQRDRLVSISQSAIRMTGIGIALPIGLLCGLAPAILSIWIGEQYVDMAPLMIILTFHMVINTAVMPLFQINIAFNKIKLQAIVMLMSGLGNLLIAFTLALVLNWGIYGVAVAGVISLSLKNLIFTPIYTSMVMGVPKATFYPALIPGALAATCIVLIAIASTFFIETSNLLNLIIVGGAITLFYAAVTWKFIIGGMEKLILPIRTRSP